jgi:hypothetical protein
VLGHPIDGFGGRRARSHLRVVSAGTASTRLAPTSGDLVGFNNGGYGLSSGVISWESAIGRQRRYSRGISEVGHGVCRVAVVAGTASCLREDIWTARRVNIIIIKYPVRPMSCSQHLMQLAVTFSQE